MRTIPKIRIGNDFVFVWKVTRVGNPENLESTLDRRLYLKKFGKIVEIHEYRVTGNIITIEFTPLLIPTAGMYQLELHYSLADMTMSDEDRKCRIDIDAFVIVGRTAQADDSDTFAVTSDMAIGFKGDPLTYDDLTPEQIALLQKPASDIATTVSNAEGLRVTAETNRNNAEGLRLSAEVTRNDNEVDRIEAEGLRAGAETGRQTAEGLRVTAETNRNNAEGLRLSAEVIRNENEADRIEAEGLRAGAETGRQTAEGLRVQAELNRQTNTSTAISNAEQATDDANDAALLANEKAELANEKAELAETATTQANAARDGANIAAQIANEVATNISPAVINNEQVQAETYNVLNARISALESLIANGIFTYLQADTLIGVNSMLYKGAEFFLYGTAAPNIAPDFIGQFYINTTGAGTTYQAKGIASAADWKQTSN